MHDWYDGRMFAVPIMDISVESKPERPEIGDRYKVNLIVRALNAAYSKVISMHLKEDFVASEDGLEMRTFVYVQNPNIFSECMEWKRKDTVSRSSCNHSMIWCLR
ncbi:hypothetical protein PC128_g4269 [Phytophthora cactorum]|nr:hypothetical protein PC128_g4269 [Phytophthora cactorum]